MSSATDTGSGDAAEPTWPEVDRRKSSGDRRARPTRFWDVFLGHRRRKTGRRKGETRDVYVDVYGTRDVVLVLSVLVLNALDAFFTLQHLQRGGSEANPIMDRLIQAGTQTFVYEKTLVVGVWLVLLAVHKHFRLARVGLWVLFVVYLGLLLFHIAIATGYVTG